MDRPLDKRRKVTWRLAGTLMDPPDRDGEVIWMAEFIVTGNFKGYRHPSVQFIATRKANEYDLKPVPGPKAPTPPFYLYTVGAYFHNPPLRDIDLTIRRVFDEEGRYCARVPRSSGEFFGNYELDPEEEERVLGNPINEGIWRAIVTGNTYDAVHVNEAIWKDMVPYLLEMSKMPEMKKMEDLFLESAVEHEELHTDTSGYDEGLSTLIAKEEKLLGEVTVGPKIRGLLRMPPPQKISKERPVEHYEVHTDTSGSGYDE